MSAYIEDLVKQTCANSFREHLTRHGKRGGLADLSEDDVSGVVFGALQRLEYLRGVFRYGCYGVGTRHLGNEVWIELKGQNPCIWINVWISGTDVPPIIDAPLFLV